MKGPSSKTWIFLRGLGRESAHWGEFLDDFKRVRPADSILPIDLPGMGEFVREDSPSSMQDIMSFVRGQWIAKANSQSPVYLVALSLGAMVAMEWLNARPSEIAGAVLVNSSDREESPATERLRWQVWKDVLTLPFISSARFRETKILELVANDAEKRAQRLSEWTQIAETRPPEVRNLVKQLMAAARFKGLLRTPDVPVLVVRSLGDRFVDPGCSKRMADKWNWPLVSHPWAGHDLAVDDPKWLAEEIAKWSDSSI